MLLLRVEIKGRRRRSQVKIKQVYSEVTGQETAVSSKWSCMVHWSCTGKMALRQSTQKAYILILGMTEVLLGLGLVGSRRVVLLASFGPPPGVAWWRASRVAVTKVHEHIASRVRLFYVCVKWSEVIENCEKGLKTSSLICPLCVCEGVSELI